MSDLTSYDRLPKRLKIGGYTFKLLVEETTAEILNPPDEESGEPEHLFGCTDTNKGRIHLDGKSEFEQFVNTLIHEIGHAINYVYGITDGADEEHITTQSANGWMQVNRDNPKLELWLHRAYRQLRHTK